MLTPVAEFDPVPMAGSVIARATLHNIDEVRRKDVRVGDTILVHKAGDVMLQTVAKALLERFGSEHVYRIGGDEFVAFAPDVEEETVKWDMRRIADLLSASGYDISVGIACGQVGEMDLQQMLTQAEQEMYHQKQIYYQQPGRERRRR